MKKKDCPCDKCVLRRMKREIYKALQPCVGKPVNQETKDQAVRNTVKAVEGILAIPEGMHITWELIGGGGGGRVQDPPSDNMLVKIGQQSKPNKTAPDVQFKVKL